MLHTADYNAANHFKPRTTCLNSSNNSPKSSKRNLLIESIEYSVCGDNET